MGFRLLGFCSRGSPELPRLSPINWARLGSPVKTKLLWLHKDDMRIQGSKVQTYPVFKAIGTRFLDPP